MPLRLGATFCYACERPVEAGIDSSAFPAEEMERPRPPDELDKKFEKADRTKRIAFFAAIGAIAIILILTFFYYFPAFVILLLIVLLAIVIGQGPFRYRRRGRFR